MLSIILLIIAAFPLTVAAAIIINAIVSDLSATMPTKAVLGVTSGFVLSLILIALSITLMLQA